ncbi:HAMP domain-containing histidine kinase [Candidatus Daviesbacteria bacterium]|nr:HAMP domain-containing histidine kinase [Candidatus Daviesbacteria bacterium]
MTRLSVENREGVVGQASYLDALREVISNLHTPTAIYDQSDVMFSNEPFKKLGSSSLALDQRLRAATMLAQEGTYLTPLEAMRKLDAEITLPPFRLDSDHPLLEVTLRPIGRPEGTYVQVEVCDITEQETLRAEARRITEFNEAFMHNLKNIVSRPRLALGMLARLVKGDERAQQPLAIATNALDEINEITQAYPEQLEEAGKLEKKPMDIVTSLGELVNLHNLINENSTITFSSDLEVQVIYADPRAIESVFINLIKNALEAGADKVDLSCQRVGKNIAIHVKDNGKGIDPDKLDKIFEYKFTDKPNGNGIGLYDVRKKILGHRGKIKVETVTQAGLDANKELKHTETDFEIILPI